MAPQQNAGMKVFLIGAAGGVGRRLTPLLLVRGDQVTGMHRNPDQQEAVAAERRRVLEMSLRMLPEKERAALVLRDLEGLTTEEVAEALGSSEATVRSQVSKARGKVKDFVERYFRRRS